MDLTKQGWIQWSQHRESSARIDPRQPGMVELTGNEVDAACGVLHYPDVWLVRMTKRDALKLGQTLVRLAR